MGMNWYSLCDSWLKRFRTFVTLTVNSEAKRKMFRNFSETFNDGSGAFRFCTILTAHQKLGPSDRKAIR